MKPVQESLRKWMRENKDFQGKYTKIKKEVLNNKQIQLFLSEHPQLTSIDIEKNINKLYEFTTQSYQCSDCEKFGTCKNIIQGYSPNLYVHQNEIHLSYEKCSSRLNYEQKKETHELIQNLSMPKEILEAKIGDIYDDPERSTAIRELLSFIQAAKTEIPPKGIYLYGPFGVGKTYFLGALANKLKELNISSMLVYMPEFVREIRESIKNDSVNQKVNYYKQADVLMLDDIGAETQSAWFRDEILGSILQYRMMERLPVFFTSNYNLKQLEEQLSVTTKGDIEKVKAGRIIERVRQVSKEVPLFGKNHRD